MTPVADTERTPAGSGPVRVALDVQALQIEGYADRGIGRYVAGYGAALARLDRLGAALLAPELPPPSGLPGQLAARGLARWDSAGECRRTVAEAGGRVVWHVTAPFLHLGPRDAPLFSADAHWSRAGVPRVTLLHDLIPLRAPGHYLSTPGSEAAYRRRAAWVGLSDLIVTNSEHTRSETLELLGCPPERVVTIGAGVSGYFAPPDGTDDELWRFHFPHLVDRPFLLTVGGSDARKATDRTIAALELLVARGLDLRLLVVGHLTDSWRRDLSVAARACGVSERVTLAGAVDDELLRAAYRRAALSLMPSLAEGAGLPVLESAACATPALASDSTSLAEMAGPPEARFDPADIDSMAFAAEMALCDPDRRARILAAEQGLAARSTWDQVAMRAAAALDGLAAAGVAPLRPGPASGPRLALVGWSGAGEPVGSAAGEPVGSGTAPGGPPTWLTTYLAPEPGGMQLEGVGVDVVAAGVDFRPASYDLVVYCLSRPGEPEWVWALAGRHPGWLWLAEPWGPARMEPLVRRSLGVIVGSREHAVAVGMQLRPLSARPPVRVLDQAATVTGAWSQETWTP